jgi:hypothetical protein
MSTKQRFQHLTLGDIVRLQNFFYDNDASADQVSLVPKVEIYRVNPAMATNANPRGLVRKATLVRRPGISSNQLTPYPSSSSPEYWEGLLELEVNQWEIGDYVDRWFLVTDPDADLDNSTRVSPHSPSDDFLGLEPINVDHVATSMTLATGSKTFAVRSGLDFEVGDSVRLYVDGSNYLEGTITAYSGTSMTVSATTAVGSGTHGSWLLIKSSNVSSPVTVYAAQVGTNRIVVPSGVTPSSETYSVSQLVEDLESHVTAVSWATATEGSSPSATTRRYDLAAVDEEIVEEGKVASESDVDEFPSGFLTEGESYTAYGTILDASVVVGYFKIARDENMGGGVMTVLPESPLPVTYPVGGDYVLSYVPGTTRIGNELDIVWNNDPGSDTDLLVSYALYEPVPSAISSASFLGVVAVVESDYSVGDNDGHVDATNKGHVALNSTDGGSTWNGTAYPSGAPGSEIVSSQASFDEGTGVLTVTVVWDDLPPRESKIALHYITRWNLEVEYSPSSLNAWDDVIARVGDLYTSIVEHRFKIGPSLFIASSRPIPTSYQFGVAQAEFYVGSRAWMRVDVKPEANLAPESIRFHYATIASGSLRYQIYRLSVDSKSSKMIMSGSVDWHEEATGMLRFDTTASPLNRAMTGFVVFFLDLPDGSSVRSPRVFFNVIDDLRIGVRGLLNEVN